MACPLHHHAHAYPTTKLLVAMVQAGVPTQAYNGMERGCLQKIFVFLFSSCLLARGQLPDYPMTIREMETEAGYFTEGGKYLGGIPSPDSVRHRIYECENYYHAGNDTSNGTVCVEWRVDKSAGATTPLGSCECTFVTNEGYCSAWVCHGVKRETECTSTNCYVTTNSNNVYCTCDVENSSGLFCNAWSCKKTTSSSDGWAEHQEYDCLGASSSGHYCDAWNGNLTASRKITVVACRCVSEWNGELVCAYWECEKMSMTKCARHDGWCNLEVSVGVGGVVGFVGVLVICVSICTGRTFLRSACGVLFGILWCAIWAIGVVIWGGVDGATYVGIMWGVPILLASISRLAGIDWWSIRRGCNRVCKRWR